MSFISFHCCRKTKERQSLDQQNCEIMLISEIFSGINNELPSYSWGVYIQSQSWWSNVMWQPSSNADHTVHKELRSACTPRLKRHRASATHCAFNLEICPCNMGITLNSVSYSLNEYNCSETPTSCIQTSNVHKTNNTFFILLLTFRNHKVLTLNLKRHPDKQNQRGLMCCRRGGGRGRAKDSRVNYCNIHQGAEKERET